MTDTSERNSVPAPLAGLTPTRLSTDSAIRARHAIVQQRNAWERSKLIKGMFTTVPIVLVGTMAVAGMNLTGAIDTVDAKPKPKTHHTDVDTAIGTAFAKATADAAASTTSPSTTDATDGSLEVAKAPATYKVRGGDTVSTIAGRYGLSTASVLALNGLSWKSVIFPGQTLKLTKAASTSTVKPAASTSSTTKYTVRSGDTISAIAKKFGTTTQAVLTANGLKLSSIIYPGQTLKISGKTTPASTGHSTPVTTTPPASTAAKTYTIKSGDTITSIAKKYKVTTAALLAANKLKISSIIYVGHKLKIPGTGTTPVTAPASSGGTVTALTDEMKKNAKVIVSVGKKLGVPDYGIVIALAAAMQESSLRNIDYGDRDSIGLFQQRPSAGWGKKSLLLNPDHASRLFYGGPSNPNKGKTSGLLDVKGWRTMSVTKAAQKVQISAYPNAYAKWETSARAWFAGLG